MRLSLRRRFNTFLPCSAFFFACNLSNYRPGLDRHDISYENIVFVVRPLPITPRYLPTYLLPTPGYTCALFALVLLQLGRYLTLQFSSFRALGVSYGFGRPSRSYNDVFFHVFCIALLHIRHSLVVSSSSVLLAALVRLSCSCGCLPLPWRPGHGPLWTFWSMLFKLSCGRGRSSRSTNLDDWKRREEGDVVSVAPNGR